MPLPLFFEHEPSMYSSPPLLSLCSSVFVFLSCFVSFPFSKFSLYSFPPVDISLSLTPKPPDLRLQLFIVKTAPFILRPLTVISKLHNRRRMIDRFLLALGRESYCESRCSEGKSSRADIRIYSHHNQLHAQRAF